MERIERIRKIYPFTALVGQERMKLALIMNIINPNLGGVLIRGEKGTAKSTAVRALADLMPARSQVEGCVFSCSPDNLESICDACYEKLSAGLKLDTTQSKMRVIDLPVSATEDRVVGTLDIEQAIKKGEKRFEPGILAQANKNILYVDEINLLDDHVVDILLDSAAMGVNFIEREGISYSHPAQFTLVGTMNPEEGDLRPQLIDRFGLVVDVYGESETEMRTEVIKRRLEFEKDSEDFVNEYAAQQNELAQRIISAMKLLPETMYEESLLEATAKISTEFAVDGHRADIVMLKTAMTIAAYEERKMATIEDLCEAAAYVLPHRMRRRPFEDSIVSMDSLVETVREIVSML